MITDDNYLIKLKNASVPDAIIAKKLKCSVEEIQERWNQIILAATAATRAGAGDLQIHCGIMTEQYKLLGHYLMSTVHGLCNRYEPSEVRQLLETALTESDPVSYLMEHAILLKPFVPPDPEKLIQECERLRSAN